MVKTGNYTKYLVRNCKIQTNVLKCIDTNKCLVYYKKVERQNKKALISVREHQMRKEPFT